MTFCAALGVWATDKTEAIITAVNKLVLLMSWWFEEES
jgi:hypothetical protein